MKKYSAMLLPVLFLAFLNNATAQDKAKVASPPATATEKMGDKNITIAYAQPSVKKRKIFGELVPFGKVWRTGANSATTFTIDKDVKIEGKELKAGKYALFTIPTEKEWTVIFNKKSDQWGSYDYSDKDDVLSVKVPAGKAAKMTEMMTFTVKNGKVSLTWDTTEVSFQVK